MSTPLRILQIEDDTADAELVLRELRRGGIEFEAVRVHDRASFVEALSHEPDLVLSDFALPQFDGLTALGLLKERYPDVPFILVSGAIGEDIAVTAMREGASDYLLKDRLSRLPTAVRGAVSQAALRRENRALEARLLRAARLESLGRLSAGLAHDLNNILLPIMMSQQLLRERIDDPGLVELLQTIETSVQRAAGVLKQLLAFGRGTGERRVPVRLDRAIAEICALLRETFPKDVNVETVLEAHDGVVLADPTQLQQILLNLCVNARDAMPGGGNLVIRVSAAEVTEELSRKHPGSTQGHYLVLSVKDTGSGIDARDVEKIFDPFFTTKAIEHGTGLGLASALGIVQGYGGFIQVESELGRGSEFKVWLREYRGEVVEEGEGPWVRSTPSGRGQLVLVVDDEPAVRNVLGASIERFGYRVLLAADAASGLRLLDARPAEVTAVVLDVAMPRLDGLGLASEIRRRRGELPIIVMTAALNEEKRASFTRLGVVEFLIKPFRTEALLKSLERVLTTRSAVVETK